MNLIYPSISTCNTPLAKLLDHNKCSHDAPVSQYAYDTDEKGYCFAIKIKKKIAQLSNQLLRLKRSFKLYPRAP